METFSRGLAAVAVGLFVCLGGAGAPRAQPSQASLPSDAPLPSCLDQTIAGQIGAQLHPRGVQKRNFRKNKKVALAFRGGLFGGDLASAAWIAGGSVTFWFTEDFGLETSFDITPIELALDKPLAQFFGDDRFKPGLGYLGLANAVWSPIHAKLRTGGGVVHADFLVYAGGGRMFQDSFQGVTLDAGAALELFITKVITFRFDAKNVMAVEEAVAETRFTNNLVATAGFTFWIPTGL